MWDFLTLIGILALLVFAGLVAFDFAVILLALVWVGFKRTVNRITTSPCEEFEKAGENLNKKFIEDVTQMTPRIRFDGDSEDFEKDLAALMEG